MAVFKEAVEARTGISKGRIALIVCAILLCAAFFTCAGTNDDAYAGDYLIKVNRQQNVATVYAKGSGGDYTVPVRTMLCITGENNSTPLGTYHISNQYRWKIMIGGVWSQYASRFNGDILLHSITYYDAYDKSTMKVARYNRLGTQMSLGCTNLAYVDAKWIYMNCDPGTPVVVYASSNPGPWGKPPLVKIGNVNNRNWDPSDDDPANPWRKNVTGVKITTPAGKTLLPGQTLQMAGDYTKSGPIKMEKGMLKWFSTNRSVADISFTGKVTAKKDGTTYIVLKDISETWSASYKLTVSSKTKSVSITSAPTKLIAGDTRTAKAKAVPTGKITKWTSSNPSVATVDNNGKVKGVSAGTTTLTAYSDAKTSEGGTAKKASVSIKVLMPNVRFVDYDGTVIKTQNVPYGKQISYPDTPADKTVGDTTYKFYGWSKDHNTTTMTLTCTACYVDSATWSLMSDSDDDADSLQAYTLMGSPSYLGPKAGLVSNTSLLKGLTGDRYTFWGMNLYQTSMDSTIRQYKYANHAIVVSGANAKDATVASGFSSFDKAPVILTNPNKLSWETYWALSAIDATHVTILGGKLAIDPKVETALKKVTQDNCDKGQTNHVARLYGSNALRTAENVYKDRIGDWGNVALLCSSTSPYDAISGSPYAAAEKAPVFFVGPSGNTYGTTDDLIVAGNFKKVMILGGPKVVSEKCEQKLKSRGVKVERIGGKDKYATSLLVAKWAAKDYGKISWRKVGFATGSDYRDALGGSVVQGHDGGLLILIFDSKVGTQSLNMYKYTKPDRTSFYGGPLAISNALKNKFTF